MDEDEAGRTPEEWERETVKQDILHIMKRFERVLSVNHGSYHNFMSMLRDVFFVPCQEDMERIEAVLKTRGEDVEKKLREDYKYFIRRARRIVRDPKSLLRDFKECIGLYKDVKDQKTSKAAKFEVLKTKHSF